MTDLIINGTAINHSSLGARRYYDGVMAHLDWPGRVIISPPATNPRLVRVNELADRGRRDAIYWSPAHRGPWFAHNHVVTVLDCINIEHTYAADRRRRLLHASMDMLLSRAIAIVSISEATKAAILRNFSIDPDRITVIAGPINLPLPASHGPTVDNGGEGFALMITNALPHKNTQAAGRAWAKSTAAARGVALRVVGSIHPHARAACIAAGAVVEQHHGIDDATLAQWIRQARFLWSPSLDEGLNLPVADAIQIGTNVLCSDIAVHREFYDGTARFFDPCDVESMRTALEDAFENPANWFPALAKPRFGRSAVGQQYRDLFNAVALGL